MSSAKTPRLLVLGANGFVGQHICQAALKRGWRVTGVCRSGRPEAGAGWELSGPTEAVWARQVDWVKADLLDRDEASGGVVRWLLQAPLTDGSEWVGVVHTVGILFGWDSPFRRLNGRMSGSGNVAQSEQDTYEMVNARTALNAYEDFTASLSHGHPRMRFAFLSAAETRWRDLRTGRVVERFLPRFFRRYLFWKRSVMDRLSPDYRVSIHYPSVVYRWSQLFKLPAVLAFRAFSFLPFVHNPIHVDRLSEEIVTRFADILD
jgi:hypothetical protein